MAVFNVVSNTVTIPDADLKAISSLAVGNIGPTTRVICIAPDGSVLGYIQASQLLGTAQVSDEQIDDRVAALLKAGANITLSYNDATGELTIASTGAGGAELINLERLVYYSFTPNPSSTFPDTPTFFQAVGGANFIDRGSLVNGATGVGISNYLDPVWVGYQNSDTTHTWDFGAGTPRLVKIARIHGLMDTINGVYRPIQARLQANNDGGPTWTTIVDSGTLTEGSGAANWMIELTNTDPTQYRFWRVALTRSVTREWIFLSNIALLG
jgi:hypothetical protein